MGGGEGEVQKGMRVVVKFGMKRQGKNVECGRNAVGKE